ncbi:hypothetical protein [Gemmatimonas sp.]|uniref:hypothetical protein n=1 Tax=Gemmatimonas sp. TaxID=1962908 RepID=UPI002ED831B9
MPRITRIQAETTRIDLRAVLAATPTIGFWFLSWLLSDPDVSVLFRVIRGKVVLWHLVQTAISSRSGFVRMNDRSRFETIGAIIVKPAEVGKR